MNGQDIPARVASAAGAIETLRRRAPRIHCLTNTVAQAFTANVQPMLQQLHINDKQNQELAALRDWLLPMLMNGQVRVAEAEEKVGLAIAAEGAGKYGKRKA